MLLLTIIAATLVAACHSEPPPGQVLAVLPASVRGMVVDATGLYVVTSDNALFRIARDGGIPELLNAGDPRFEDDGAPPIVAGGEIIWAPPIAAVTRSRAPGVVLRVHR